MVATSPVTAFTAKKQQRRSGTDGRPSHEHDTGRSDFSDTRSYGAHRIGKYPHIRLAEAFLLALTALRPVSREQVEKVWRGKWQRGTKDWVCSRCGHSHTFVKSFCPNCGAPMTDEAVEMVMERMEALKDGSTTD
jgi:ribosomal protein S27AE